MNKFKMNISLELLKRQIDTLAEVVADSRTMTLSGLKMQRLEHLEGILNLLGAIRGEIDPVKRHPLDCCHCDGGFMPSTGFRGPTPCPCACHHDEDEGRRTG